jgi:hypothetical protein
MKTSLLVYAKQWGFAMGAFAHMVRPMLDPFRLASP